MFNLKLKPIRPKEDLILNNNDNKEKVSGKIVQYLLAHQINGIRFLYNNSYKKVSK